MVLMFSRRSKQDSTGRTQRLLPHRRLHRAMWRRHIYIYIGTSVGTTLSTANDEGRGPETPRSVDRGGRPIGEDRRQRRFSLRRLSSSPLGTVTTTAGPSTATASTVLGPLNGQDLQWAPSSSPQLLSGFRRAASILRPAPPSATLDASLLLAMENHEKAGPDPAVFSTRSRRDI